MPDSTNITKIAVDMGDNFTKLFQQLANQIGTTVDKIFPWFVKQQIIEGWCGLTITTLILIVGFLLLIFNFRKRNFEESRTSYIPINFNSCLVIIGWIMFGIGFLAFSIGSTYWIGKIINPEYAAVQDLIQQLSKIK